jgi:putative ABC transport system permease protein
MAWRFAWRALRRDFHAGELRVLALALVVAVAAVTAVGFFTDRVGRAMERQASELLAADMVVASSRPLPGAYAREAQRRGLKTADLVQFPSVILTEDDDTQLVAVKAVSQGYPLRGGVRLADAPYDIEQPTRAIPPAGRLWLDPRLFGPLGIKVGDRIDLGAASFEIDRVLAYEPDRGGDLFQLAPRVLLNIADLERTQLITPASRVRYRLLVAGEPQALADYLAWLEPKLQGTEHTHDVRDARPEMTAALDRAASFLGLAAVVAVVLAGAAIAVASQRFAERQADTSAILRCLGASQAFVLRVLLLRLLAIALGAAFAGALLGYLAQIGLAGLMAGWFDIALPLPSARPFLAGLLTGLITLLGFALPRLLSVRHVPVLRVLRRDLGASPPSAWAVVGAALLAIAALMGWQAGDVKLAAWVIGGTAATLVLLTLVALVLVRAVGLLRGNAAASWRFGLSNLSRRAHGSVVQLVAFGVGIMALLLLAVVRTDVLSAWEMTVPANAPNLFIINIQPEEVGALQARLQENGIVSQGLYPMVRGRMVARNQQPLSPDDYDHPRAQRLLAREFNLSWAAGAPPENRIVEGKWWQDPEQDDALLSVEQGIAELLGIELGDRLTFRIADREVSARVANLREVEWDSFEVNFFVIATPATLREYPATFITSFYLPDGKRGLVAKLVRAFPSITVLDVAAIMGQVRSIISQAALAVEYVFGFTLLAGFVVLYAAVQSSAEERVRENAVLRTLGASRSQVVVGLATEFTTLGMLAGLLAASAAGAVGYVLSVEIFELNYSINPSLWVIGVLGGGLGVGLAGLLVTRAVLSRPPLESLRRT